MNKTRLNDKKKRMCQYCGKPLQTEQRKIDHEKTCEK